MSIEVGAGFVTRKQHGLSRHPTWGKVAGMNQRTLSFRDVLPKDRRAHLTRSDLGTARPRALYSRDFYQLFWVQNGAVRLHEDAGHRGLSEGDVVFARPGDTLALQGRGEAPFVAAVSFHPDDIKGILDRHANLEGQLFWSAAQAPMVVHRDSVQLAALNHAANTLERSDGTPLAVEAFLLPVLSAMLPLSDMPPQAPDWLVAACRAAQDRSVFCDGAAGLVAASGRGHPHVSRSMRQWFGQSPSEYVNAQRMAFAAARLTGGNDGLAEIAEEIGIPNLSHFHKLFRAAYGVTPQKYRAAHQRNVFAPE